MLATQPESSTIWCCQLSKVFSRDLPYGKLGSNEGIPATNHVVDEELTGKIL